MWVVLVFLWFAAACGPIVCEAQGNLTPDTNDYSSTSPRYFFTNAVQFGSLSARDYLNECAFHLRGVVTLVDTNRNLVVLQDGTGALALNFPLEDRPVEVGQWVSVKGTNCYPYISSFPDFPFHPSGRTVQPSFEAPSDFGEYYLTRMRGYLHPPVTGKYAFWVASDNSSELWLSSNDDPSKSRRIAFIPHFAWVDPHEWSRFPSQCSEPVLLEAGKTYYIEALQEQTTGADHLAVAWRGPGLAQSVIDGRYLTPWGETDGPAPFAQTNGILREYWTNFSVGNLPPLTTPRPYESALTVRQVEITFLERGELPNAKPIVFNQQMLPEENFHWVELEGRVAFSGIDRGTVYLELTDGHAEVQVRALHWTPEMLRGARGKVVRVEGVCEETYDRNGVLVPALIWATADSSITPVESVRTNLNLLTAGDPSVTPLISTNTAMSGFYTTHGVVTFNDRVLGRHYLFVQEDTSPVFVSLKNRHFKNDLQVGQGVELGGPLRPGKSIPVINPLVVTDLGWHPMPAPLTLPVPPGLLQNNDGRWTEIEGVVHSLNSNGTVSIVGKAGRVSVWVGQSDSSQLGRFVDAKLRVRGVMSLTAPVVPLLMVPSPAFIDVEEEAPQKPFEIPIHSIASLAPESTDPSSTHRVKLTGVVTYCDAQSFVIQDASGGQRIRPLGNPSVSIGDTIEVVGFPVIEGARRMLTEALVRPAPNRQEVEPDQLDISQALSLKQSSALIHISANLISQQAIGDSQVLELQEQQRVFSATLPSGWGRLPNIAPGSRLGITGVCDNEPDATPADGRAATDKPILGSLNILLRSPTDVMVLKGPPWWTWRKAIVLFGALLAGVLVALLWVHLLRMRLERQHAAQLAFSQQMLDRLENERRRIAGNLHDSLGQVLLAIKNQALLGMQRAGDDPLRQRLGEISTTTSQAIEEVREITQGLRPYQLDRLGLTQAIRDTVTRASASSPVSFASRVEDIDQIFNKESEIHVYRIVQEAVSNVLKHSSATEAAVVVKQRTNVVSLSIRDNGRGFDMDRVASTNGLDLGYGLSGIAERVRIIGGSLAIDSRPGEGTSLTVEIPVLVHEHDTGSNDINCG